MTLEETLKKIRPCDPEQRYVFISYSSRDRETVWPDVLEFQNRGYNVWLDEKNLDKTKPSWKADAIKAVEDLCCALVVFYVSEHSLASEPCYNEMCATVGEEAVSMHYGEVPFVAVEVSPIGDITKFGEMIHKKLLASAMPKAEKAVAVKTVSHFIFKFFSSNNEKVRVRAKNDPDRILDYYEDILDVFPDSTLLAPQETAELPETPAAAPSEEPAPAASPEETGDGLSPEDANLLGDDYYYGRKGLPQDYARAAACYRSAADRGYSLAQFNLGYCYKNGKGVPRDLAAAARYYRMAADQGRLAAQYTLANCYYFGEGVPKDYAMAVRYYRMAADKGDADAQWALGNCYAFGRGVPQDYAAAVRYYEMSAQQGNPYGQDYLGDSYYDGRGVPQDYAMAVRYYRLSADNGNMWAQARLASCFEYGFGTPPDKAAAVKYYRMAADQGHAGAKEALIRLGAD